MRFDILSAVCLWLWHVSLCSGEAGCKLLYSVYFTLLLLGKWWRGWRRGRTGEQGRWRSCWNSWTRTSQCTAGQPHTSQYPSLTFVYFSLSGNWCAGQPEHRMQHSFILHQSVSQSMH